MPTRKISGPNDGDMKWTLKEGVPCRHPGHDPPRMAVLSPGTYEHECPACHRKQVFHVRQAFWACRMMTSMRDPRSPCTGLTATCDARKRGREV